MKLAIAFVVLLFASVARADSTGLLLVSGTSIVGPETVTASYELDDGILVPGSIDISFTGPGNISFTGAVPTMGDKCNEGFTMYNGAEQFQITFYEDSNCLDGNGIQPGDLGLFYFMCPAGDCQAAGVDTFGQGFAMVTDPPAVPEPSSLLLLLAGVVFVLLMRGRNEAIRLHSRN